MIKGGAENQERITMAKRNENHENALWGRIYKKTPS